MARNPLSLPRLATTLQSGPERRDIRLVTEEIASYPDDTGHALIRNEMTLIDSGFDLERVERSAAQGSWIKLGRHAIGTVVRGATEGLNAGDRIYWPGPHADYATIDLKEDFWVPVGESDPLLLPAGIGAEAQAGLEPAKTVLGKWPGESVVLGQGMLGHLAAHWLKTSGSDVTVVDNSPKRLEFSRKSGLKQKVDTHNFDWMERLQKWHPSGVHLLVDATGAPAAIESLLPILREGGVLCLLGQWRNRPLPENVQKHLDTIGGSLTGPSPPLNQTSDAVARVSNWIELIQSGTIPTERLLTHHINREESPVAVKRFAAGIRSWQGAVIHWDQASFEKYGQKPG